MSRWCSRLERGTRACRGASTAPPTRAQRSAAASRPRAGRLGRDLEVLARRRDEVHRPADRLDQRRVVGGAPSSVVVLRSSARSARRGGRPAASAPPTARERSSVAHDAPPSRLLDRVGDAARRRSPRRRRASAARQAATSSGVTSGRAASWTSTTSLAGRGGQRGAHRVRALAAARARRWCRPAPRRPGGSATTISVTAAHALERGDDHSTIGRPASVGERLGDEGPKAFATTRGHDERDRHHIALLRGRATFAPAPTRRAGCRGAPRPRPRPCRARTSARRRGSSSRG